LFLTLYNKLGLLPQLIANSDLPIWQSFMFWHHVGDAP
jgi:hypothetical protein